MAETLPDIDLDETLEKIRDHVRKGLEKKLVGTKLTQSTAEIVLKEYRRLLAEAIEEFVAGETQSKSYEKFGDYLKDLRCCGHLGMFVDSDSGNCFCTNCGELWMPSKQITKAMNEAVELLKESNDVWLTLDRRYTLHKNTDKWLEKYGKDFG